jgi:hypothetical protein
MLRAPAIVIEKEAVACTPFVSVPDKVKLKLPAVVGLPETAVPPPLKTSPGGNAPALKVAADNAPVKLIACE